MKHPLYKQQDGHTTKKKKSELYMYIYHVIEVVEVY